ncbi:MAG: alpha-glucan family phosphorylase [Candidatus Eisenbacteria bacterium]|uniref:glycogen phosphorylase n=1 Tax=Eiseniibacteriota bacterium TaxID=2212470 RepID=A0A849SKT3_UNCEI|nr:alpha-glucan family phosphorylase [Candidatus Eisenbacteria bacterium]
MSSRVPHTAYFCMEYGLHESFPIYSGGLGVLAGDFIKSARDLGRPLVAVGLLWERGYTVQRIGPDGLPFDAYPEYDHSFLRDTGVRIRVRVLGNEVPCAVKVTDRYGHVPLYLIEPLRTEDRWITHRLYEAGADVRVAQEILLGIGGVRALNWLGIPVSTYHFNEGHAVFAGIEMIAERMEAGLAFPDAWADTRRRIVFTTHTPVTAGNEQHAVPDLRRLGACLELSGAEMRAIGGDPFNMTVAGLRLARAANAVSQLHGETARAMWAHVSDAAPILAITNGVHAPTWQSAAVRDAQRDASALWAAHEVHRAELRAAISARTGHAPEPGTLLVGFARRAAAYKRSDLVLQDPVRLEALLESQPVSFVFAGKAHPDDKAGKAIIGRIVAAQHRYPGRVTFLENYDMALGRLLTRGCDVWLNNPILPLEASGTSGMKAALNGVLNLSILDGWWPEGCEHGVNGWAIESPKTGDDAADLDALHHVLREQVLTAWAMPERWRAMMSASIAMAEEKFTSDRMVEEYFERIYPESVGLTD